MSAIIPVTHRIENYLVGASGAADFQGGWISSHQFSKLIVHAWWSAFAATAGTLAIQAAENQGNGSAPTQPVTLTPTVLHGAQPAAGTQGQLIIVIENLPALWRLIYTRSGGGTTNQFFAAANMRAI